MVQSVQLFELATQQSRWLAARQAAVAGNIANVNTPGYRSVDVAPFKQVLENATAQLSTTATSHIPLGGGGHAYGLHAVESSSVLPSENSVQLEQELMKSGEVRRAFELNTAIVKAFHRMMMSTVRA
ncbi:MAG: flagellar basal body rod protein FlgB [Mesorhizobium sp.]